MNVHPRPPEKASQTQMVISGQPEVYLDPKTAHEGAGDPGWSRNIGSCLACFAQRTAKKEAGEAIPEEGAPW